VKIQIEDLGRMLSVASARVKGTTALVLVAATALGWSAFSAGATTLDTTWSSAFNDSLWTDNAPVHLGNMPLPVPELPQCFVGCGPIFGAFVVRRAEFLTSNTADVSVNKVVDSTGHAMGVSGTVVTERFDPSGGWSMVGERELDNNENHSWSLLSPDTSLDAAPWLPIELYRFESSSWSTNLVVAAPAGAIPEVSTWTMMLIGFAWLGAAGCGNIKRQRLLRSSGYMSGGASDT
jgi:hypothetical protein